MAEALGIAGSAVGIISLAVQLGDGILKLKSFWMAVKHAPEEILYILDELDITHVLLMEIEDSLGSQTISPAAARSLRLCQKGVDILNNAVKELEDEMKRRKKWGGVKMVMKKELLEKMEKRLGRANSLMMMAHQNYIALSKSRHDEQVRLATQQFSEIVEIRNTLHSFNSATSIITTQQQISSSTTDLSVIPSANTTSGSRSAKTLSKYQKTLSAKLRLPFFSGVWELCAYQQSISGWDFKLRIYNVVDYDAPIMTLARNGDVAGMQQLFETQQASPYDVNIYGQTILHVGILDKSWLGHNYRGFFWSLQRLTNLLRPAWSSPFQVLFPDEDIFAITQYLVSRADCDIISNLPTFLHYAYYLTPESMKWILQSTENPIHNRSHRERALLVLGISNCRLIHMKEIVWLTLDNMDLEACVQNLEQAEFFKLLRRITHSLGFIMAHHLVVRRNRNTVVPYGDHLKDHLIIIHDLFLAGSKYHHLKDTYKDYHHSFLLRLLKGAATFVMCDSLPRANASFDLLEQCLINSIETWLDQIISEGIDLIEYGQWEKKTRDDANSLGLISVRLSRPRFEDQCYAVSLLSFIHGPTKSDWQFWFTVEPECIHEGWVKEFWDMVENPERQIPGAWNFDA
ncbi:uncharacterized protein EAF02_008171 [Botrytis sinoallii]|uniref:uncharacterized protein n=1 Tax=Botrytis sinoallii TaxID=1463999 RepID=UPI001902BF28|nr:uncharacterized protein EAF02_008171 [Botrytis sinoallii]KAF7876951.1 hypothetical protein EAF02_008171 [Botrytis sinoallii]